MTRSLFILALCCTLAACDFDADDGLYNPNPTLGPDPVAAAITPPEFALSGVDVLTITGENFSTDPAANQVFFDEVRAQVLSATPTALTVRAPLLAEADLPRTDIKVRISVIGAENFSNTLVYRLDPAAANVGDIQGFEQPFALTTDAEDNLYVTLFINSLPRGIFRISPDGTRTPYVDAAFKWEALGFDAEGQLYGVRNVRAVFRYPAGGGAQETWAVLPSQANRLVTLDFDADGNLWTGGAEFVHRIQPDGTATTTTLGGTVRAVNVFDGQVYVGGGREGVKAVWRYTPNADGTLSGESRVFALPQSHSTFTIRALAFAADGTLFVGTDAAAPLDAVFEVAPDGTGAILYPGVIQQPVVSFAWSNGTALYMAHDAYQEAGVTRNPNLLRIETRRQGER